jgi:hypothetical protein
MIRLAGLLVLVDVVRRLERARGESNRAAAVAEAYRLGHRHGRDVGRAMGAHPAGRKIDATADLDALAACGLCGGSKSLRRCACAPGLVSA